MRYPAQGAFFGFAYCAIANLLAWVFRHQPEYNLSMFSGCLLVDPFLAMGLYDISRRHEQGMFEVVFNARHVAVGSLLGSGYRTGPDDAVFPGFMGHRTLARRRQLARLQGVFDMASKRPITRLQDGFG